jgi:hypothetical protein
VSVRKKPIYVGQTMQSIAARLRMGFTAKGNAGYHGYAWRRKYKRVDLDIWILKGAKKKKLHLETIEGEVVYLIRHHLGQWPAWQTEIHFHRSTDKHRELASKIYQAFKRRTTQRRRRNE